jgi:hypothetical protein
MSRAALACVTLFVASAGWAAEMTAAIDCTVDSRPLDSLFQRYGKLKATAIVREEHGLRFTLPAANGTDQTGVYSYFSLAGDFEVAADYELLSLPPPQGGYGVSCGMAVNTKAKDGSVSITRGYTGDKKAGYVVTRGKPGDTGMEYKSDFFPATAPAGRLVLRREKADVVCLAADGPNGEPRELCRVPFTNQTVREVRFYADPGGSPTAVDARLMRIQVRAVEIAGGVPKLQPSQGIRWWWWAGGGFMVVAAAMLIVRKRKGQWPWPANDD